MEPLVKVTVFSGTVTGNAEDGITVIDAHVGEHLWIREQSLADLADRVKRWVPPPVEPAVLPAMKSKK